MIKQERVKNREWMENEKKLEALSLTCTPDGHLKSNLKTIGQKSNLNGASLGESSK